MASVEDLIPSVFDDNNGLQVPMVNLNNNWNWPLQEPALIYACVESFVFYELAVGLGNLEWDDEA